MKISVIIMAYNVEKYIKSIINKIYNTLIITGVYILFKNKMFLSVITYYI